MSEEIKICSRRYINMSYVLTFLFTTLLFGASSTELSENFYEISCPNFTSIVKEEVGARLKTEPRMGASLLRLHFHDCFATGCDASVLLDDTASFIGEKRSEPNNNSARGFEVIDNMKVKVETICPGIVSCADILAAAARDSLGGPSWNVLFGRRDSTTANKTASNMNIKGPHSNLNDLIQGYASQGFTPQELVALSGGHTIGLAKCQFFTSRLSDGNIDPSFKKSLKDFCKVNGENGSHPLDMKTPLTFDNNYFMLLTQLRGLLHSDQQLLKEPTKHFVEVYANNKTAFFEDFTGVMIKMSKLGTLTGNSGIIRTNCRSILS
ncbi:Cationic peroxidase 1 [Bienertia sinuspersici]